MDSNNFDIDCDLCGSSDRKLIKIENGYPVSRCLSCSLVYVSKIPQVDKGKVIGEYYSGENEEIEAGRLRYKDVSEYLMEEIEKVFPGKGRLLDIGCGYGFFLVKAREQGWEVFGTELSEIAVEYMRTKQGLLNVWFAELSEEDFPLDRADVINMTNVLEHVPSPTKTLDNCGRLLEKGGVLLVRVPNMGFSRVKNIFVPFIRMAGLGTEGEFSYLATPPPIHLTGFSSKTLRKYFEKTGFTAVEVKPSKLSSRAKEHFLYRVFELFVGLLYRFSFRRINISPTILAIARKVE